MGAFALLTSCIGVDFAGVFAVTLGIIALERIRSSGALLRGRGLAWTGIGLGACAALCSIAFAWGRSTLQERWHGQLDAALRTTFAAIDAPGETAAMSYWIAPAGSSLTPQDLGEFARTVNARFGTLKGFAEISKDTEASFDGSNRVTSATSFEFADARVLGSMTFRLVPGTADLFPEVRLESVRLLDSSGGNLTLPTQANDLSKPSPDAAQGKVLEENAP